MHPCLGSAQGNRTAARAFVQGQPRQSKIGRAMNLNPSEVLDPAWPPEQGPVPELAVALCQRDMLKLAQSTRLAGRSPRSFQHLIPNRGRTVHNPVAEFVEESQ